MKINLVKSLYTTGSMIKQKLKLCAIAALSVFVLFLVTGCNQNTPVNSQEDNQIFDSENEGVKVGNDGVNAGIAKDDDVEIVSQGKQLSGNMVSMSVEDFGRQDPFLPASEQALIRPVPTTGGYELLPPPENITPDSSAAEVLRTVVSGIMYDKFSPSAILKIDNSDYLVRTGDNINGYKILAIARDCVTVQRGANVYKAGVGELLTGDGINFNNVSNLESKFGGNRNKR